MARISLNVVDRTTGDPLTGIAAQISATVWSFVDADGHAEALTPPALVFVDDDDGDYHADTDSSFLTPGSHLDYTLALPDASAASTYSGVIDGPPDFNPVVGDVVQLRPDKKWVKYGDTASMFWILVRTDGTPFDLTDCTVTLTAARRDGTKQIDGGECVIVEAAGVLQYTPTSEDFELDVTAPGGYSLGIQFLVTDGNARLEAFPNEGNGLIIVQPKL